MRCEHAPKPPRLQLKELILARGLTQQEVAEQLGWHPSKLSRIISGERGVDLEDAVKLRSWSDGALAVEVWLQCA